MSKPLSFGLAGFCSGIFIGAIAIVATPAVLSPTPAADGETHIRRGLVRAERGDLQGAIAEFSTAIRLDPEDPRAYRARGFVLSREGKHVDAIADLERAAELFCAQGDAANHQLVHDLLQTTQSQTLHSAS